MDLNRSNLPSVQINEDIIEKQINILDLVVFSKLEKSKSEIRRLVKGSAIKINNEVQLEQINPESNSKLNILPIGNFSNLLIK